MKILHLSALGVQRGGAARATNRLHRALLDRGVNSHVLADYDDSSDPTIDGASSSIMCKLRSIRRRVNSLPVRYYDERDSEPFSPTWLPERRLKQIRAHDPDIVHLHWVARGFLNPKTIAQIDVPVVWTLHDMWPFTGGCHYSNSCSKFMQSCGKCPQINSENTRDLSSFTWNRKKNALDDAELTIVSPSEWLAKQARKSSLFHDKDIEIIPNAIDTNDFSPRPRSIGIETFNLESERKYILFGANYQTDRKGGDLLMNSLKHLTEENNVTVLTFGGVDRNSSESVVPVHNLGYISDDNDISLLYSTADATVVPSREDNLPNVAVESMVSGTPVIAFNIGGLPDIVTHKQTGYLSEAFDVQDLANGIKWASSKSRELLSESCRKAGVKKFSSAKIAERYSNLYQELLML